MGWGERECGGGGRWANWYVSAVFMGSTPPGKDKREAEQ